MDVVTGISLPMWAEIGIAIFTLISGVLIGWWRQTVKTKTRNKKLSKEINWHIHSQIHELLTELRFGTDAARAQLIQFHNGGYFMDGVSMGKLSLTHESLSKGVSADGDRLQSLLLSLFTPLIGKVIEDSPIFYHTKDDKDSFFKNFIMSGSVASYVVLPVRYENNISGYIMLQWCSPVKSKGAEKDSINLSGLIKDTRNQIQIHLDEQLRIT